MRCIVSVAALFGLVAAAVAAEPPVVTVYNKQFAVVREAISLDLKAGVNEVRFTEVTAHVEPDSVILRDPQGRRGLRILEQNYRNDPISPELLLSLLEGQTIDFLAPTHDQPERIVRGKLIRAAYVPHAEAWDAYGLGYWQTQARLVGGGAGQPLIEVEGRLRFGLPGTPLFPALPDKTILKPTLHWLLESDAAGKLDAELSYVTGGMSWKADYNVLSSADGDTLDLIGWVTIDNQSGRMFENARIKLMAGDVAKIHKGERGVDYSFSVMPAARRMEPPVEEKTFDEYHLYTLQRPSTLRDRQTKQVEFLRAAGVQSQRVYVYDGLQVPPNTRHWDRTYIRGNADYGTQFNPKVWVMREFANREDNHLGMPLPAGRLRFYRQDDDGRLEFIGENEIDHTPKDETVRVFTGNAFDIVGERWRMNYQVNEKNNQLDESFEIKLRNHKDQPVAVRVVEHLYRWYNWEIREKSQDYVKKDAQTIEFIVDVPPGGETTVTYLVHYWW